MAGQSTDHDLGEGGLALWTELAPGGQAGPGELTIIVEACRIKDRLDKMHRLLAGDANDWLELQEVKGHEGIAEIVIDKSLSEARQQALALKGLLAELRQMRGGKLARASAGGSKSDDLAAKRAERLAKAQSPQRP
jgi:hypothetical protein